MQETFPLASLSASFVPLRCNPRIRISALKRKAEAY
jgi:hypothetical protein